MKNTLQALDDILYFINKFEEVFEEEGSWLGDGVFNMFFRISEEVQDMQAAGLISKDMAQEYQNTLVAMRDNEMNAGEGIQKLKEINTRQTEDCEKADKKISEAFSINWENDKSDVKDSKKVLEHIGDLMRFYENSYEQNGALESVDMFCDIANGIKEAVKDKMISEKTAKALMEPLEDIRKNIFNDNVQKKGIQEFNKVLQEKVSNTNDKESQQTTLDSIINGIASMGSKKEDERNMQKTDVAKTDGEAKKALEEQRIATKENSGKTNEAQDKALREQIDKTKENISPELKKDFNYIKSEILRRYNRAKVYVEAFSRNPDIHEYSLPLLRSTAEEFEPLVDMVNKIDLDKSYDEKALQEFGWKWREAMIGLPIYYRELEKLDAAYEDVWGDFNKLNNIGDDFFKNILGTEQKNVETLKEPRTEQQPVQNQVKTEEKPKPINHFLEAQRQANAQRNQEDVRGQITPEQKAQIDLLYGKNGRPQKQDTQEESIETKPVVQEPKKRPLSHSELEDMGRARIEAFKEKYKLSVENRKRYNEKQWEQIFDQELGFTDIEDKFREDFVKGMREFYWKDPEIRNGVRTNDIPKPSIKAEIEAQYQSSKKEPVRQAEQQAPQDRFAAFRAQLNQKDNREQNPRNQDGGRQQPSPELMDSLLHGKNGKVQAAKIEIEKHPDLSQPQKSESPISVPKTDDRFAAFKRNLEKQDKPLEQQTDKVESFKAGMEKTKNLSQQKQKDALQKYLMQKRKREWEDF